MQKLLRWIGILFLCTVCLRILALFLFPEDSGFQLMTLSALIVMFAVFILALVGYAIIFLIRWLKKTKKR